MLDKEYIRKRISVFLNEDDVDPSEDKEINRLLKAKLSIFLPQRASLDDSLANTVCDHEILDLIVQYRALVNQDVRGKVVAQR